MTTGCTWLSFCKRTVQAHRRAQTAPAHAPKVHFLRSRLRLHGTAAAFCFTSRTCSLGLAFRTVQPGIYRSQLFADSRLFAPHPGPSRPALSFPREGRSTERERGWEVAVLSILPERSHLVYSLCSLFRRSKLITGADYRRYRAPAKSRHDSLVIVNDAQTNEVWATRAQTAMCVQSANDQCVLQFTLLLAAGCVLHRRTSRAIHHRELS